MNDRTFERETMKRILLGALEKMEEAAAHEIQGEFSETDEKDLLAVLNLMPILMMTRETLDNGEGYIGQVFRAVKGARGAAGS